MQHLFLLHGAIGASQQLRPLEALLAADFNVHLFDFSGHGEKGFNADFSIAGFASELQQAIKEKGISEVFIFGYSMGGYIATYLAAHAPELVTKLATLATKFEWTPEIAAAEIQKLQPSLIKQKIPAFANRLAMMHGDEKWEKLLHTTAHLLQTMGANPPLTKELCASVSVPVLLLLGEADTMVTLSETEHMRNTLPQATLITIPDTAHPIEKTNLTYLSNALIRFFK